MDGLHQDIKDALPKALDSSKSVQKVEQSLQTCLSALQDQLDDDKCLLLLKSGILYLIKVVDLLSSAMPTKLNNSILNLILDNLVVASEHGNKSNGYLVSVITDQCLGMVLNDNFPFSSRVEVVNKLNLIFESTAVAVKEKFVHTDSCIANLKNLFRLVLTVGDYEFQVCIVEFLFRLLPRKLRQKYAGHFIKDSNLLQAFLQVKDSCFEVDCRKFLNYLNKSLGVKSQVYSFPCQRITFGSIELQKPCDEGYDDFWVDFNKGSKRIIIFCENAQLSSQISSGEDCWETLSVWKADIHRFDCEVDQGKMHAKIQIKRTAVCVPRDWDESRPVLHIVADAKYTPQNALKELFGQKKVSEVTTPVQCFTDELSQDSFQEENESLVSPVKQPVPMTPGSVCSTGRLSSRMSEPACPMSVPASTITMESFCEPLATKKDKPAKPNCSTPRIRTAQPKKKVKTPVVTLQKPVTKNHDQIRKEATKHKFNPPIAETVDIESEEEQAESPDNIVIPDSLPFPSQAPSKTLQHERRNEVKSQSASNDNGNRGQTLRSSQDKVLKQDEELPVRSCRQLRSSQKSHPDKPAVHSSCASQRKNRDRSLGHKPSNPSKDADNQTKSSSDTGQNSSGAEDRETVPCSYEEFKIPRSRKQMPGNAERSSTLSSQSKCGGQRAKKDSHDKISENITDEEKLERCKKDLEMTKKHTKQDVTHSHKDKERQVTFLGSRRVTRQSQNGNCQKMSSEDESNVCNEKQAGKADDIFKYKSDNQSGKRTDKLSIDHKRKTKDLKHGNSSQRTLNRTEHIVEEITVEQNGSEEMSNQESFEDPRMLSRPHFMMEQGESSEKMETRKSPQQEIYNGKKIFKSKSKQNSSNDASSKKGGRHKCMEKHRGHGDNCYTDIVHISDPESEDDARCNAPSKRGEKLKQGKASCNEKACETVTSKNDRKVDKGAHKGNPEQHHERPTTSDLDISLESDYGQQKDKNLGKQKEQQREKYIDVQKDKQKEKHLEKLKEQQKEKHVDQKKEQQKEKHVDQKKEQQKEKHVDQKKEQQKEKRVDQKKEQQIEKRVDKKKEQSLGNESALNRLRVKMQSMYSKDVSKDSKSKLASDFDEEDIDSMDYKLVVETDPEAESCQDQCPERNEKNYVHQETYDQSDCSDQNDCVIESSIARREHVIGLKSGISRKNDDQAFSKGWRQTQENARHRADQEMNLNKIPKSYHRTIPNNKSKNQRDLLSKRIQQRQESDEDDATDYRFDLNTPKETPLKPSAQFPHEGEAYKKNKLSKHNEKVLEKRSKLAFSSENGNTCIDQFDVNEETDLHNHTYTNGKKSSENKQKSRKQAEETAMNIVPATSHRNNQVANTRDIPSKNLRARQPVTYKEVDDTFDDLDLQESPSRPPRHTTKTGLLGSDRKLTFTQAERRMSDRGRDFVQKTFSVSISSIREKIQNRTSNDSDPYNFDEECKTRDFSTTVKSHNDAIKPSKQAEKLPREVRKQGNAMTRSFSWDDDGDNDADVEGSQESETDKSPKTVGNTSAGATKRSRSPVKFYSPVFQSEEDAQNRVSPHLLFFSQPKGAKKKQVYQTDERKSKLSFASSSGIETVKQRQSKRATRFNPQVQEETSATKQQTSGEDSSHTTSDAGKSGKSEISWIAKHKSRAHLGPVAKKTYKKPINDHVDVSSRLLQSFHRNKAVEESQSPEVESFPSSAEQRSAAITPVYRSKRIYSPLDVTIRSTPTVLCGAGDVSDTQARMSAFSKSSLISTLTRQSSKVGSSIHNEGRFQPSLSHSRASSKSKSCDYDIDPESESEVSEPEDPTDIAVSHKSPQPSVSSSEKGSKKRVAELSPSPAHSSFSTAFGNAAPVKGAKKSSKRSRQVSVEEEKENEWEEDEEEKLRRLRKCGLLSGPSSTVQPTKATLKRKFSDCDWSDEEGDENDSQNSQNSQSSRRSLLLPRELFPETHKTPPESPKEQQKGKRKKEQKSKQLSRKPAGEVRNRKRPEPAGLTSVEESVLQLEMPAPSVSTDDRLSQEDMDVGLCPPVAGVASLLKRFGFDFEKQMQERKHQVQEFAKGALKLSSKRINHFWAGDRDMRDEVLNNFKDHIHVEISALEVDVAGLNEIEKKTEAFYLQQLKMLRDQRGKLQRRVKSMNGCHENFRTENTQIDHQILGSQRRLECQMKKDMEQLKTKMLLDMQQQQLRRVKESLHKHFI